MDSLDDRVFQWFFENDLGWPSVYSEKFLNKRIFNYSDFLYQLEDVLYQLTTIDGRHREWECGYFSYEEASSIYLSIDFDYEVNGRQYFCIDKDIEPILIRIFNGYLYRRSGAKREVEELEKVIQPSSESHKVSKRL